MKDTGPVDILLVEDNADHATFILRALKEGDRTHTYWVKDGEEALEFLWQRNEPREAEAPARPLVVFLDIHLPKLDGHGVLRQMRREDGLQSIPVVMLTTSDRKEEIEAAYNAGANGYVTKPFKLGDFVTKLESLKQYWTSTSEVPAA